MARTLVWFRHDLRTDDNPALHQAMQDGEVVAVFCTCLSQWRAHDVGANRLDFLYRSLAALARRLEQLRVPLRILDPDTFAAVPDALMGLANALGCDGIALNAEYPLNEARRDRAVVRAFEGAGKQVSVHHGSLVRRPGTVLTNDGGTYTVFSPFRKKWLAGLPDTALQPLDGPSAQAGIAVDASPLPTLPADLRPEIDCAGLWSAGEEAALGRLRHFADAALDSYKTDRDRPAVDGTSTLSPHLSVGSLSPRRALAAAAAANAGRLDSGSEGATGWISEIIWREFYRHIIDAFPDLSRGQAFRPEMDAVHWRNAPRQLEAWQQGRTGYPIVDAAQRQLLATGWMHNRLRMVTAMFLTKHLLIDWREGERWFMQHLVDGDFASNNGGWQWSASTGTDAQPYFRIFNPVSQGEKFDPDGAFTTHYVPEVAGLAKKALHQPWTLGGDAPADYPAPLVEHKAARERALETFKAVAGKK